jgi:DEAD/DEAH box helicase domain-containing protein
MTDRSSTTDTPAARSSRPAVSASARFLDEALTTRAFQVPPDLPRTIHQPRDDGPCDAGPPARAHSLHRDSDRTPLDDAGAQLTLGGLLGDATRPQGERPAGRPTTTPEPAPTDRSPLAPAAPTAIVVDLETQRSAEEVGGWEHPEKMGLAVAVVYDLDVGEFRVYGESHVNGLIDELTRARLIVGFNLRRFDFAVLRGYAALDWDRLPALDILEIIHRRLGFRLSLDHLATETLGERKTADGLQSIAWYRAGQLERVIDYCKQDVLLTKRLYEFGRRHGYLLYRDHQGRAVRLPVDFNENLFPGPRP